MEFIRANMEALMRKQPFLVSKLVNNEYEMDESVIEERTARNDSPILVIHKDGKENVMNSRFHPEREAETYAAQFEDIKDYAVYLFLGFGNGTIPREIAKQGSDLVRYAFYEPCKESFLYVMQHYDISDILGNDKVTIYVEGINDLEVAAYLPDMIEWANSSLADIFTLPKYQEMYPDIYVKFVKIARDVIARAQMGMNTIVAHAHRQLENAIYHLRFTFYGTSALAFQKVFPEDMPAILVSAGPSLKKNMHLLKEAKNKAFILCADTALKRLLAENIIPDAVICVDPIKWAAYEEGCEKYYKDILWITTSISNAYVTDKIHSYRNVFIEGEDQMNNHFYSKYGLELPRLATGGSVATTAFSLLELWDFKTIIFIGQDLAMTGDKRYSDSTVSAREESEEKGFTLFETEGYDGGTVLTREDYNTYLKWFEGAISITGFRDIINATEGGAMIHGAKNMTLAQALAQYGKTEYNVRDIIGSVPYAFDDEQRQEIEKEIRQLPARVNWFLRQFKEGKELSERGVTLVSRENYSVKEFQKIHKRLDAIDKATSNEMEFIAIANRACKVERTITRDMMLATEEEKEDDKLTFETLAKLYGGFVEATEDMKTLSERMVKQLDEQGWR